MKTPLMLTTLALAVIASGSVVAWAARADGRGVFLAQKCNACHSVSTAGIERVVKSEKMAGPDLVNVPMDAKTMTSYLRRTTKLHGKNHAKAFKGTSEELATVVQWLQSQKR